MLDEKVLRSESFRADSVPVVMADGQAWMIPRPEVHARPVITRVEDRDHPRTTPGIPGVWYEKKMHVEVEWKLSYGRPIQPLVDAAEEALASHDEGHEGEPDPDLVWKVMQMGVALLQANYDIPDEAWPDLVRWSNDGGDAPMWGAILRVVRGLPAETPGPAADPVSPSHGPEPVPSEA